MACIRKVKSQVLGVKQPLLKPEPYSLRYVKELHALTTTTHSRALHAFCVVTAAMLVTDEQHEVKEAREGLFYMFSGKL